MKDCTHFTEYLETYSLSCSDDNGYQEFCDHLATCHDCRQRLKDGEKFDQKVKESMGNIDIPTGLADRIEMNLRYAEKRSRKALYRYFPVAASIMLVLAVLFQVRQGGIEVKDVVSDAVRSHNKYHPLQFTSEVASPRDVPAWFQGKLDFDVRLPAFSNGIRFVGGRKCKICKNEVAYLFFEKDKKMVSLFVFNNRDFKLGREKITVSRGLDCVMVWSDDDLGYALVSSLDPEEMAKIINHI